jgi:hypothetical protein
MSVFYSLLLNRMKAVVAFFLAGLGDLVIQSVEKGGGINLPDSAEAWIRTGLLALMVAVGVYQTPNKPLPEGLGKAGK